MADDLESFGFVGTINDDEELKFDDETSESDEEVCNKFIILLGFFKMAKNTFTFSCSVLA